MKNMTLDDLTFSVYHYTRLALFEQMKTGLFHGESYVGHDYHFTANIKGGQRGLQPGNVVQSYHSIEVPEGCEQPAIWAFLEPVPENWKNSKEFPEVWPRILRRVGWAMYGDPVILEVQLTKLDNVYVLDWGFMEESSWGTKAEDVELYWGSRVKLTDYDGSFRLPEVLIFNEISEDRLFLYEKLDCLDIKSEINRREKMG